MSNLLQAFQGVDPTAPASMANDLRACLVAINRQAQAEPSNTELSLNAWWQWLDDEGYNREAFAEALQRLGAARISEAHLANLVATCGSRGDEPNGLALFQELLQEIDKDSLDLLHHFEALSLTEEHELAHEAGGSRTNLTTRQKVEIGVGVPLVVGGIGFAYRAGRSRRPTIHLDQIQARTDQIAREEEHRARIIARADEEILVRHLGNDSRLLADDIAHGGVNSTQKYTEIADDAFYNTKSIEQYTSEDVERRVSGLVYAHSYRFLEAAVEQRLLREFKEGPKFRSKVMNEALNKAAARNKAEVFMELNNYGYNHDGGGMKR